MAFDPKVGQEIIIDGVSYRFAEHPAATGMPFGQSGRAATVYKLESAVGPQALKVFFDRFRLPSLVSLTDRLARFASIPGLAVCQRTVLTPQRHASVLRPSPELIYAVVMPWIEGPTWLQILQEKQELSFEQSLSLARDVAALLSNLEQQGFAHCDLSNANLLLPALSKDQGNGSHSPVELVDVEQMYAATLDRPVLLPSGSYGYAHKTVINGVWEEKADRFAGAILLTEILSWADPTVRPPAWGESYFDPDELQKPSSRFNVLATSIDRYWGKGLGLLLNRAWNSDILADCPTFGEWLLNIPETIHLLPVETFSEVTPIIEVTNDKDVNNNNHPLDHNSLSAKKGNISEELFTGDLDQILELDTQKKRRPHYSPVFGISLFVLLLFAGITTFFFWNQKTGDTPKGSSTPEQKVALTITNTKSVSSPTPSLTFIPTATMASTITPKPTPTPTITPEPTPLGGGSGRIAFISKASEKPELMVMDIASRVTTPLTNDGYEKYSPLWSPDGKTLAYLIKKPDNSLYITIIDQNLKQKEITYVDSFSFSWLKDKPGFLFIRVQNKWEETLPAYPDKCCDKCCPPRLAGTWEEHQKIIFDMGVRGCSLKSISETQAIFTCVERVVIQHLLDDYGRESIVPIKDFFVQSTLQSPNSSDLLVMTNSSGHFTVSINTFDGKNPQNMADKIDGSVFNPVWSPDGLSFAFSKGKHAYDNVDKDICVINVDGTGLNCLISQAGLNDHPTWSPDGKYIAYESNLVTDTNPEGDKEIIVIRVSDGQRFQVTSNNFDDYAPTWSSQ